MFRKRKPLLLLQVSIFTTRSCNPIAMVDRAFNPGADVCTVPFLRSSLQLFLNTFSYMPNIKVMVFVWMFCAHEFSDHPVPVSNDVVNLEARVFKLLNSPLQTLQLHYSELTENPQFPPSLNPSKCRIHILLNNHGNHVLHHHLMLTFDLGIHVLLNVEVDIICSFRCSNSRIKFAAFDQLNTMALATKMLDHGIPFKHCWLYHSQTCPQVHCDLVPTIVPLVKFNNDMHGLPQIPHFSSTRNCLSSSG